MPKKPKIVILGSANMDMVIKTEVFPKPGETIIGGEFMLVPGGKGANQAVAAARLGGEVCLISRLGDDLFGRQNLENFEKEGIDTRFVELDPVHPSGVAQITVNKYGENMIIVAPGANAALGKDDVEAAQQHIKKAELLLMQLEVPLTSIIRATKLASAFGVKVILNPAPAQKLPDELFPLLFMITPNETEAEILTGIKVLDEKSALLAAEKLVGKGTKMVIITMGAAGAYVHTPSFKGLIPTQKVKVLDTTAAGDTFNGALAVALVKGMEIQEAVKFALKAATLSVQRMGAQSSIPHITEVLEN